MVKNEIKSFKLNKKCSLEYTMKFKKILYNDILVIQFLVEVSKKLFVFTKVLDKNHLANKNLNSLFLFSDILCFLKTYKASDELYISENKKISVLS